jgi:transposase InsO family protein
MSWQEINKMSLRREFVSAYHKGNINMSELCRRFKVSRPTGYALISRAKNEEMESAIQDQSSRPKYSPNKTPDIMEKAVLKVRQTYPYWGGRKIKAILEREGEVNVPSASTITAILKRHGQMDTSERAQRHFKRFERAASNHLWQVDFKGHFAYEKGRCHPLTILDDHSRYSIALEACTNEREKTVRPLFIRAFERYGLPLQMNFDNGVPWGSIFYACRYTSLSIWLITHGIKVSYSRPRHPQTNGKDERFHRTLKLELLTPNYFVDQTEIQDAFVQWQAVYNHKRPHEALNMKVPADRYKLSQRVYHHQIQDYEYSEDYLQRRVDSRGRLSLDGRSLFVGQPFEKRILGVRSTDIDGERAIYFRHQKLATIQLKEIPRGSMINIYSMRKLVV